MAEQKFNINGGFFNSLNGDRTYLAEDMNRPYRRVISEGIFATPKGTPSTDLQVVSANSGMNIICKKGEGLLAKKWFENPSDIVITVPANTNVVPRRDSVVLQIDARNNASGRIANIVYKEGTPSSNPMPPDINNIDNVTELRLANIYVAAGANYIGNDAIVDLRGSSECPWITHLLYQVDTSVLFRQYQDAYQNYYEEISEDYESYKSAQRQAWQEFLETLTDDLEVTTNLIISDSDYTTMVDGETTIPINIPTYNQENDILQVYINRLRATPEVDYTISQDGTTIELTKDLTAGQSVNFLCLKSVVTGDVESVLSAIQTLNDRITSLYSDSTWINFILESGAQSFDNTTKPAIRKIGSNVYIRGAIKGFNTLNTTICTLPLNMRPSQNHQFTTCAISDGGIIATCVFEVSTAGSVKLIAKSGTIANSTMLSIATNFVVG